MKTLARKTMENKGSAAANSNTKSKLRGKPEAEFTDQRPAALTQLKLQSIALAGSQPAQVIQRVIEIVGDKVYKPGDEEALKLKYPKEWKDILAALKEFGNYPKTLEAALSDKRYFFLERNEDSEYGVFWNPQIKEKKNEVVPEGQTIDAGEEPVLILRPAEKVNGMRITGLNMCVGIVITAQADNGLICAAAGAHFVTPNSIEKEEKSNNFKINDRGMKVVDGLLKLIKPCGNLSATLVVAVDKELKGNQAEKDSRQAAELIKGALGIPTAILDGSATCFYFLNPDGEGFLK